MLIIDPATMRVVAELRRVVAKVRDCAGDTVVLTKAEASMLAVSAENELRTIDQAAGAHANSTTTAYAIAECRKRARIRATSPPRSSADSTCGHPHRRLPSDYRQLADAPDRRGAGERAARNRLRCVEPGSFQPPGSCTTVTAGDDDATYL